MGGVAGEIVVILGLILTNGLLAMSEMAVVSSRPARLRSLIASGNRRAEEALEFAENPDRLLAAVQVGITLVAVLSGAYAGATVAERLAETVSKVPWLAGRAADISMAAVVIAITYLTLVLGELAPKQVALRAPEPVAMVVARPLRLLAALTAPAVWLLTRSTAILLLPFRDRSPSQEPVTAGEIEAMVDEGADDGVFTPMEQDLVRRALSLRSYQARDIMVPRPVLVWLPADDDPADHLDAVASHRQSYYPVFADDGDAAIGLVWGWDIVVAVARGRRVRLGELVRKPVFVTETAPAIDVLDTLHREQSDAAVVVDEHGSTAGMISREGVLRAIGGRAALTLHALDAPQWEEYGDGSVAGDGLVALPDLRHFLGLAKPLPEEARYGSVGGFMMARLQKMPEIGDSFDAHGFRFEVTALDHHRISRFRVTPQRSSQP